MCQRRPLSGPPRAGSSRHDGTKRHASVLRSSPVGKPRQPVSVVRLWRAPASQIPTAQLVQRCHQLGLAADPGVVLRGRLGPRSGALFIRFLNLDPVEPTGAGQPVACAVAAVADVEPRHRRAHRGRDTSASLSVEPALGSRPADRRPAPYSSGTENRKKSRVARGIRGRPTPLRRRRPNSEAENGRGILLASLTARLARRHLACGRRTPLLKPPATSAVHEQVRGRRANVQGASPKVHRPVPSAGFSPPDCCGSPWRPATR